MVDLLVPPPEETGPGKLTVGKVYGGMLILENWKLSRFGQGFGNKNNSHTNNVPVSSDFIHPIPHFILKISRMAPS